MELKYLIYSELVFTCRTKINSHIIQLCNKNYEEIGKDSGIPISRLPLNNNYFLLETDQTYALQNLDF